MTQTFSARGGLDGGVLLGRREAVAEADLKALAERVLFIRARYEAGVREHVREHVREYATELRDSASILARAILSILSEKEAAERRAEEAEATLATEREQYRHW